MGRDCHYECDSDGGQVRKTAILKGADKIDTITTPAGTAIIRAYTKDNATIALWPSDEVRCVQTEKPEPGEDLGGVGG